MEMRKLQNYINGKWMTSRSSEYELVVDPSSGHPIAQVPLSTEDDVDDAVRSAYGAFETWQEVPVPRRARILFNYHYLLDQHRDELASLITLENGKSLEEAKGEVQRGLECVEFAAGAPSLMMGQVLPDIATGIESAMYRYPIGVVGGITPYNFPMMVPCWMFPIAIACGNTFIMKPSERTPLLACRLVELLTEAGLPDGVCNLVHGAHTVVNRLLSHPQVPAISFVGSQPVAKYIYQEAASYGKRVQALAGAKNHAIVLGDANMELAVNGIISSAFGSAGQRCMACSVVVAVGDIADQLVERLAIAAQQLRIGDGAEPDTDLGPVIRQSQLERAIHYIDSGVREQAKLVLDGRQCVKEQSEGYFIGPTIFDHVATDMSIWQDEIFAPVLSVMRVPSLRDAIELINTSEFGNGAVLYSSSGAAVRQFREKTHAGMLGVNINVPAPMAFFPFSGWKNSFYGDLHANGTDAVNFYTRKKMITSRW